MTSSIAPTAATARVVPLLPIDDACVAEARRALIAQGFRESVLDEPFVARLLLVFRALPLALDVAAADPGARLGLPRVEGDIPRGGGALAARAHLDEATRTIDVRVADPLALYDGDAPVLCRVKLALTAEAADKDEGGVLIQRFGMNRR